jgi:hypothetical protein
MEDDMTGDQQPEEQGDLPGWPVHDDLSLILTRVVRSRKSKEAAKRLANSPETRAYLDAGLRLIAEQLTAPTAELEDEDLNSRNRPFFAWLSRKKIIEEAERAETERSRAKKTIINDGNFRDRWEYQPEYIEDLLAYSLWSVHWSPHVTTARDSAEALVGGEDLAAAIHEVAYLDMNNVLDNPAYRVSIIGSAMADRDTRAREVVTQTYQLLLDSWKKLYIETIESRGLTLRPDVSVDDLANMLAALADGIGLRIIAERDNVNLIDHAKRQSLLGKAAMALMVSCVDAGDGLSLEDVVRMFTAGSQ